MPSDKPRVNVVVDPAQHRLLADLGQIQGRSASSYLRELLDGAQPYLEHLLSLEKARLDGAEEFANRVRSISASVLEHTLAADQGNLFSHLGELSRLAAPGPADAPAPHNERKRVRKREIGGNGASNA